MAFELHNRPFPGIAATGGIVRLQAVQLGGTRDRGIVPVATSGGTPGAGVIGITHSNTGPSVAVGQGVTVHRRGDVVRVIAGGSLANGADIGVASTNGVFGPVASAPGAAILGQAMTTANPGEAFSLYIDPRRY